VGVFGFGLMSCVLVLAFYFITGVGWCVFVLISWALLYSFDFGFAYGWL